MLKMLPLWSTPTELHKLQFHSIPPLNCEESIWRFSGLRKLLNISFSDVHDVTNDDVEELLKCNPQVTSISLVDCPNIDLRSIFEVIAEHGIRVEVLRIRRKKVIWEVGYGVSTEFFGRLNNLKHLSIDLRISNLESVISCQTDRRKAVAVDRKRREFKFT